MAIVVPGCANEVPVKQAPTHDAVGRRTDPVGPWRWVTAALIEETIRVWEPRYERKIGSEEAALILSTAVEFFRALADCAERVDGGDPGGAAARASQVSEVQNNESLRTQSSSPACGPRVQEFEST
jgi:hypothetical protein